VGVRPGRVSSRGFVPAYLVVVAVAIGVEVSLPPRFGPLVIGAAIALAMIAVLVGVRMHDIGRPLPAYILAAGLAMAVVSNTMWNLDGLWRLLPGDPLVSTVLDTLSYVSVLAAAVVLVIRQAPRDSGRVVDAALVGICGAGMLWEWVLRPHLTRDWQDPVSKISTLISVLALMAILGSLLHVLRATSHRRASLAFLLLALSFVTVGRVLDPIGYADETNPFYIACHLSIGAALLHPAARFLTVPTDERPEPVTGARLLRLGLVLAVIPLVGGVPQVIGQPPDGLLLTIGTLATIPLVLFRISQLAHRHGEALLALAHQATHDELTGLPNRRTVHDQLDRAVQRFDTGELDHLTVLFCDLDGFKPINDRLGHQVGDEVLRIAAARLRGCLRADDLVGRLGGDEFLIVSGQANSSELVTRVEGAFADPLLVSQGAVMLGVSVGVARAARGTPTTSDRLVATADEAMYEVKRARHAAVR
jgi:diguanylate cyclase (GGDEF)-like protein